MALIKKSYDLFPNYLSTIGKDFFEDFGLFEGQKTLPAVNIVEENNEYRIEVAAPGFKKEDFKVNAEGNLLSVSCEKEINNESKKDKYTRKEFSYSSFKRTFTLPEGTDTDKISGTYNDGILTINISKKEETWRNEPKKISIG